MSTRVVAERIDTSAVPVAPGAEAEQRRPDEGQRPASDPNDVPEGFDPRFDVEKPGQQQADAGDGGPAVATSVVRGGAKDLESVRRSCGASWVDEGCLKKHAKAKGSVEGPLVSTTRAELHREGGTTHTDVCVKHVKPGVLDEQQFADFAREAAPFTRIRHPCIVENLGAGCASTSAGLSPFLVFRHDHPVCTLKDVIIKQMETPYRRLYHDEDSLRWCLQLARGLRALHETRPLLVHRGVWPGAAVLLGPAHHGTYSNLECKLADC